MLRALTSEDDRAPVPALHLGLALLWSGQRADATSALQETRSLDPDGLYGQTADDVLHPAYRKGEPLWVRSRPVRGSLAQVRARAAAAPRSQAAQLDYAYGLQFSSRTRARLVAERALALDASNIDAQVAVIVLGFDKDVPGPGRRGAWRSSCRAARTRRARASTSASCSPGSARTRRPRSSTGRSCSSIRRV